MFLATTIQNESRVKKTLLNARVNLIFYFLQLLLSFFSRKIFLDCLGDDFIGLTGTLQNLLGFLNLAELGIGSAIGFLLYKPLYDHNEEKLTEIISVMGYLYRWIGCIILIGGVILSAFLPFIFPLDRANGPEPATPFAPHINYGIIYFAFYAFLGSSLIGYFINYRQNLLGADQRNYVVTAYFQTANLIKVLIQMALAYWTKNLWLWIAIEFTFGIIYSIILNWKINQTYPWLKANIRLGKKMFKKYPEVMKKTKQLFIHRLGGFVQFQTIPFLIYAFSSLNLVAYYQNYTIVISRVSSFFSNLFTGIGASVGNLIAEGNKEKILNVFWELLSLRFFLAGIICIPSFLLIEPFIKIWIGEEYILPEITLVLILIPIFIGVIRSTVDEFNFGFGNFWDVWAPISESVILISVSIICGYFLGLNGVLLGQISSLTLIILLWKPFMLFHWGFKLSVFKYWFEFLKNIMCITIPFIISFYFFKLFNWQIVDNFFKWTLNSSAIFTLYLLISYICFLVFTNGMKSLNKRFIKLIKSLSQRILNKFNVI